MPLTPDARRLSILKIAQLLRQEATHLQTLANEYQQTAQKLEGQINERTTRRSERRPRQPSTPLTVRERIHNHLLAHQPMKARQIADDLNIPIGTVSGILSLHFHRTDNGWTT